MNLNDLREEYDTAGLESAQIGADPLVAIERWLSDAVAAEVPQANAMAVATVDETGRPSLRTVLLKEIDTGLVFYTNSLSRKGRELASTPSVAASLTWVLLHRQIRVEGRAEAIADAQADRYWSSRPVGAQIAAAASPQSEVVPDRAWLERRVQALEAQLAGAAPARPTHWTGYRIVPSVVEFWQGRRNRLHDRIRYRRGVDTWSTERLAP
jgi:pyridoxamine 5'-phosphate oxidase